MEEKHSKYENDLIESRINPIAKAKLWEIAKVITEKQIQAAKLGSVDNILPNVLEENWFDYLVEELIL